MPWRHRAATVAGAVVVCTTLLGRPACAADLTRHLAERGPSVLLVGTLFTIAAPPALLVDAVRGQPARLHACRLSHGVKMLAVSAVLLPAGLVLAPFHLDAAARRVDGRPRRCLSGRLRQPPGHRAAAVA
jgi:hypothetical protein